MSAWLRRQRGLDSARYGELSVVALIVPPPIQQHLHMREKTSGVFYRADYQFAAARRKSPPGDAVI